MVSLVSHYQAKKPLPNPYYIQIGRTLYKTERVRVWNQKPADGGEPRWMPRTRLTPVEAV